MVDLTRQRKNAQKRASSFFVAEIVEGEDGVDATAGDMAHLVGNLPPNAIILDASIQTLVGSDGGTATGTIGSTSTGSNIMTAGDLDAVGSSGNNPTERVVTGTGMEVWLRVAYSSAATNVGKYLVVIEYLEYDKTTGEYTSLG